MITSESSLIFAYFIPGSFVKLLRDNYSKQSTQLTIYRIQFYRLKDPLFTLKWFTKYFKKKDKVK